MERGSQDKTKKFSPQFHENWPPDTNYILWQRTDKCKIHCNLLGLDPSPQNILRQAQMFQKGGVCMYGRSKEYLLREKLCREASPLSPSGTKGPGNGHFCSPTQWQPLLYVQTKNISIDKNYNKLAKQ